MWQAHSQVRVYHAVNPPTRHFPAPFAQVSRGYRNRIPAVMGLPLPILMDYGRFSYSPIREEWCALSRGAWSLTMQS